MQRDAQPAPSTPSTLTRTLLRTLVLALAVGIAAVGAAAIAAQSPEKPEPAPAKPATLEEARAQLRSGDFAAAAGTAAAVTAKEPGNGQAWLVLGSARQQAKQLDEALAAYTKAAGIEATAPQGSYNAACIQALLGNRDEAFKWLARAGATRKIDMTQAAFDPDLATLKDDPRLASLMPSPDELRDPFVEKTRIIHEWDGEAAGDQFGWIARDIGDVDGDGIHDFTTSAPTSRTDAGRVYVYSGRSGKRIWVRSGDPGDKLGIGVEAAGDVNADGIPDVVAGAPGAGKAFVYSGADGSTLVTLEAGKKDENFGRHVSDVGDVNGDGHADVLVGAPGARNSDDTGRAGLYSGSDGSLLLDLHGENAGDQFGSTVGGRKDKDHLFLIAGAPHAGPANRGRVYVYTDLSGKPRWVFDADETGFAFGFMFVSVVGDVDADGVPDIYATDFADSANGPRSGRVYVFSGKDGSRLLTLSGESAGDAFGIGVADAGDVNHDGHADLIIGAWRYSAAAPSGGKTYLYSGKDGSLIRAWTCKVMGDTFGFDATGMGDVDGDGTIDLLVTSAWSAVKGPRSGRVFVISGR